MIKFTQGNVLTADTEALVNTVNTMGVIGKGLALQFKERFPENFRAYVHACGTGQCEIGKVFVTKNPAADVPGPGRPRYVINFPTKEHWRNPSLMEYVEKGLEDLRRVLRELDIHSVAVPPLGSGVGGLEWEDVRSLIKDSLGSLEDVEVLVYEPAPRLF